MSYPGKKPTLFQALLPLILLIILLTLNVFIWRDQTLDGSNQLVLIFAAMIAALIDLSLGIKWEQIRKSMVDTIGKSMSSILILMLIGALSGTWLLSGVVPALIYYGLDLLHPRLFLFAAVVISSLVSLATGSSWSTIATIGVALLGIGSAMGISKPIIAGAIISGAYFGDKMSPLSDTTNLAPAMAGTDIFTHIRYMSHTTAVSMGITLIIFFIIGLNYDFSTAVSSVSQVKQAIGNTFNINLWLFLVPTILIILIIKKMPPIPALMIGALLGGIAAVIFQPHIITQVTGIEHSYAKASYIGVLQAMYGDISITTGDPVVDDLFSTSGMRGMLLTIWLILAAMMFGGAMQAGGLLQRLTEEIAKFAKDSGSLVASTAATCILVNITASDQYLAIVVPGQMYSETYKEMGFKPELLSRTLEDSGTVTSVLVPWNTGGATQSRVLGVPTLDYLPYSFFNYLSPVTTVVFGYLKIDIKRDVTTLDPEIENKDNVTM